MAEKKSLLLQTHLLQIDFGQENGTTKTKFVVHSKFSLGTTEKFTISPLDFRNCSLTLTLNLGLNLVTIGREQILSCACKKQNSSRDYHSVKLALKNKDFCLVFRGPA